MKKAKPIKVFNLFITVNSNKISNVSSFAGKNKLTVLSSKPTNLSEFVELTREEDLTKGTISRSLDSTLTYISVYDKSKLSDIKSQLGI